MKKLYYQVTPEMMHAVATLTALEIPNTSILRRTGATLSGLKHIHAADGWDAILESKKVAIAALMRGDA